MSKKSDPFKSTHIAELARFAAQNGILELEWEEGESRIMLRLKPDHRKSSNNVPIAAEQPYSKTEQVRAPDFGEFQMSAGNCIAEGEHVCSGQILAYIRIGPLLQPVRAPFDGKVNSLGHVDGDIIGYGDILFQITLDGN